VEENSCLFNIVDKHLTAAVIVQYKCHSWSNFITTDSHLRQISPMCVIVYGRTIGRVPKRMTTMAKFTLESEQLQAIMDAVQSLQSQNASLKRSQDERIREDAARQESRHRQHSLSIAADAEERNRGRAHQIEWDAAYENLGRIAPAMREGETAEAYQLRLASGVQTCSPDHRDLDLDTVLFRQPESFRETILSQIRQDALKPTARHFEIPEGEIREFKRRDESGREVTEFASKNGYTFIHKIAAETSPRRIVRRMYGVDRVGSASTRPVEKPRYGAVCPFTTAYRAARDPLPSFSDRRGLSCGPNSSPH
jgi:hypothetical protein